MALPGLHRRDPLLAPPLEALLRLDPFHHAPLEALSFHEAPPYRDLFLLLRVQLLDSQRLPNVPSSLPSALLPPS